MAMAPRKHARDFRAEREESDDAGQGQGDVIRLTEDLRVSGPKVTRSRRQGSRS